MKLKAGMLHDHASRKKLFQAETKESLSPPTQPNLLDKMPLKESTESESPSSSVTSSWRFSPCPGPGRLRDRRSCWICMPRCWLNSRMAPPTIRRRGGHFIQDIFDVQINLFLPLDRHRVLTKSIIPKQTERVEKEGGKGQGHRLQPVNLRRLVLTYEVMSNPTNHLPFESLNF